MSSAIDKREWVGILKTNSAVAAIKKGQFPDILEALATSAIDKSLWVSILKDDSVVVVIKKGEFPDLLHNLQNAGIETHLWSKYLNKNHTVTTVAGGTIDGGTTLTEYKDKLGEHGIEARHFSCPHMPGHCAVITPPL